MRYLGLGLFVSSIILTRESSIITKATVLPHAQELYPCDRLLRGWSTNNGRLVVTSIMDHKLESIFYYNSIAWWLVRLRLSKSSGQDHRGRSNISSRSGRFSDVDDDHILVNTIISSFRTLLGDDDEYWYLVYT